MNSVQCVSKVLERIVENMNSFSPDQDITHLMDSVCKIGSYALKKSLPCSLLKNVLLVVNKFQPMCNSHLASTFLNEVYQFYKTENLCVNFKLSILSCLGTAVEIEVLTLLNKCLDVHKVEDLDMIKSVVLESCLPVACAENLAMLQKANNILKKSLIFTNGNPVVGYLSYIFNKTVKSSSKSPDAICLFCEDLFHLEILFSLPQQFFCQQQQIMYVKPLMSSLVETVNQNLCNRNDLVYLLAIYPTLYFQILTFHKDKAFDAFKILKIFYNIDPLDFCHDFKIDILNILKNPLWKCMLEN